MAADLAPLKQAFNNCGSALAEHGRTEEALAFYRRALDEDSRYVLALRNTVIVHRNRHEWGRAITALRAVLKVDPNRREDRLELARLLDQEERPIEALAEFEALAKADPADPLPWAEAGKLLHQRGDRTKAEAAYVEALRLNPHDEEVAESLSRLRQGVDLLAQQLGAAMDGEHAEDELAPRATMPGLPADPAQALMFDPMSGLRLPPDARPSQ
jgi:tetratricopeptide (TPR) repeat protein